MKRRHTPRPHRLTHFALMVAMVVVLRFVAWDLHHAASLHETDTPCDVCAVFERGGDGVAATAAVVSPPAPPPAMRAGLPEPCQALRAPCPPARAPPSFES
ncbi:MAG: hypothetical protein ACNA8G_04590, partial [Gammaproteobacteria bacterium]